MEAATGIDVGGTTIKAVLLTRRGTILREESRPTPHTIEAIVAAVVDIAHHFDTTRVGVALPGIIDEGAGVALAATHLPWKRTPIRSLLTAAVGRPVAIGHDVRCGARAELRWGDASPRALYVALGTGLACSVADPRPAAGRWEGEIGQPLIDDPDSPGSLIRLEEVASARAIARRYAARHPGVLPSAAGAQEVFDLLRRGDPDARVVVDQATDALAAALLPAIALLAPDRIILAGGLAQAGDELTGRLGLRLDARCGRLPRPPLIVGRLGPLAQAMGATLLTPE